MSFMDDLLKSTLKNLGDCSPDATGEKYEENVGSRGCKHTGSVTIPAGATLTLEEGAMVNDKAGVLATAGGGSAPVVIVPETNLTTNDEGELYLMEPPSALPGYGATCAVTYNGVVYDCPVIDGAAIGLTGGYIMGNTTDTDLPQSNADAPFILILFASGMETPGGTLIYGQCTPLDGATSVTLSIVQTEAGNGGSANSGSGDMYIINATPTKVDGSASATLDKTYAETLAAIRAGKHVVMWVMLESEIRVMQPIVFSDEYMLFGLVAYLMGVSAQSILWNSDGTVSAMEMDG